MFTLVLTKLITLVFPVITVYSPWSGIKTSPRFFISIVKFEFKVKFDPLDNVKVLGLLSLSIFTI